MTLNDIIAFKSILFNNYVVISSFQFTHYRVGVRGRENKHCIVGKYAFVGNKMMNLYHWGGGQEICLG